MRLRECDDSGVASIVVVLLMVLLLGALGISVDVGRAVAVTRSAQNSADAVALAMAKDCARNGSLSTPQSVYDRFIRTGAAIGNGQSQDRTDGSCLDRFVEATASETMHYTFSKIFGASDTVRSRPATAKWGQLTSATGTFPIIIPKCGLDTLQLNELVTLYSDDVLGCDTGSGQFGLVAAGCTSATVSADGDVTVAQGNAFNKTNCTTTYMNANFLDKDVLVPIWTTHSGSQYRILKYAVFHLTAWSANGTASSDPTTFAYDGVHALPNGNQNPKKCPDQPGHDDNSGACIQGFIKGYVTQAGGTNGVSCAPTDACLVYLDS